MGAEFEGGYSVRCDSTTSGLGYETASTQTECKFYLWGYEASADVLNILTCIPFDEGDSGCSWFLE